MIAEKHLIRYWIINLLSFGAWNTGKYHNGVKRRLINVEEQSVVLLCPQWAELLLELRLFSHSTFYCQDLEERVIIKCICPSLKFCFCHFFSFLLEENGWQFTTKVFRFIIYIHLFASWHRDTSGKCSSGTEIILWKSF